jgi:1,4-alpha-glucan branching enzyme
MEQGYLALVLHAHLPYVRHPEYADSLEENWLFEAITETYIPLFLVMEELVRDGIDFRLTFSVTPTLASMLGDPLLQSRYLERIERQIELAEKEVARTASDPMVNPVARMYRALFTRVREAFAGRYRKNLLQAFRRFQDLGRIEIIASAATHGYLPLLAINEGAVRAQVGVGAEHYRQVFGRKPQGFWLPECAYNPGLDRVLAEHGIRYTILETHGITRADQRPHYGVYAPVYCPSGVAAFGRDPDSSRQVWSSIDGYPGDFDYREFYRDIGYDLDLDYIGPYIHKDGIRVDTGFKYHRITGKGEHKDPYVAEWAEHKAERHAAHFLEARSAQVERLSSLMDRKPLVVAPYDAELFGHWWFEGPRWLDYLIRKIAVEPSSIRLVTLSDYLDEYPVNQTTTPSMSSWGHNGYSEVWLNQRNHWIYPHLHSAAGMMEQLAAENPDAEGLTRRALNQAARELMLAQASDWAFMINSGAMDGYASRRTRNHLGRFHQIQRQIASGRVEEEYVAGLERQDNIFPEINTFAGFAPGIAAHAAKAPLRVEEDEPAPERLHIVMLSSEVAPLAKTGGLADMAGSLAASLEGLGHQVSVIMPAYRRVFQSNVPLRDTGMRVTVSHGGHTEEVQVLAATIGQDVPVYLIRSDRHFDRHDLYGTPEGDFPDNAERFAFFCRAALELLREIGAPDVLHAHDWQTAPAIFFLKAQPERYPGLAAVRTVLTIHNLGYQGLFSPEEWRHLDLDRSFFTMQWLEFYGKINFLKGGLAAADAVTTVSPTYAREIVTAEHGFGLEGVLARRGGNLIGILNGVDYRTWNPATDRFLAANYSPEDMAGKRACKADLQRLFGLPEEPGVPLMGMVCRLAAQKGVDLLEEVLDEMLARDLQFVLVGSGDRKYQDIFEQAARRHQDRMRMRIAFEEELAHKVEAGSDLFLMPSRYEPSGLNQLYSLKYGTIPVVRATGGLKDSVQEFDAETGTGTGYLFEAYEGTALLQAIERALSAYAHEDQWKVLMRNAMRADYSWNESARKYVALYYRLLGVEDRAATLVQ